MRKFGETVSEVGVAAANRIKAMCQRDKGMNTQVVVQKFVLERVVHRLFSSEYADEFALKGGLLMMKVEDVAPTRSRATDDIDIQIPGFAGDMNDFVAIVRDVLSKDGPVDDGLQFDLSDDAVKASTRNEDGVPGGSMHVPVRLGGMLMKFKIDVTFDSRPIFAAAVTDQIPSILPDQFGPVTVRRVPMAWSLADKVQAQSRLGEKSTRLKDFYDMYLIAKRGLADPDETAKALRMTFDLFKDRMPATIDGIPAFGGDYGTRNAAAWEAEKVKRRFAVDTPDLPTVIATIREAVAPMIEAAHAMEAKPASAWLERRPLEGTLRDRILALRAPMHEQEPAAAPAPR